MQNKHNSGGNRSDWHWQMQNRITNLEAADKVFNLTDEEKEAFSDGCHHFTPFGVTPYYAETIKDSPVRKTVLPSILENISRTGETSDPLGEEDCSPFPDLVHKYKDRVLFLVSNFCPAYCRYCTRGRRVGNPAYCHHEDWDNILDYIKQHCEIRDVILSGGDPLMLSDEVLDCLLARIKKIPHIETIRIGTKAPIVLPMRITPHLVEILKKYPPVYMAIHVLHPVELTPEVKTACNMLADAGIQLASQSVLLKGVNDNADTLVELMRGLIRIRVRPYYLFQCDAIEGSGHFRVKVAKALQILEAMKKQTTGMCMPHYAIDFPNRTGKIVLVPNRLEGFGENTVKLRNFNNEIFEYPD